MNQPFFITLGRQLGSGGRQIGEQLARTFHIAYYDKELLNLAAQSSGLHPDLFKQADEHTSRGLLGGLFGTRFPFVTEGAIPDRNCLSHEALFQIQSDVVRHLANEGPALFVGRCADYILREHPRCINFFITANLEDRIARIRERCACSRDEALQQIEQTDRRRAAYYNFYSNRTWGEAASYHLCVNSSVLGLDGTTRLLARFVQETLGLDSGH